MATEIQLDYEALKGLVELDKKKYENKKKTSFWASDCEKNVFDIYHAYIGTPKTNPPDATSLWRFKCGEYAEKGLCDALDHLLKLSGEDQLRVDFEWEGIRITGYVDGVLKTGEPVEIKSYYGDWAARDYKNGLAKSNYLKQLAVYMYFMKAEKGYLYMVPMPMGEHFVFSLEQYEEGKFKGGGHDFDITDEFKKWKRLYEKNIEPRIEPKSQFRYKYDIEATDWASVAKSAISKARNGHKVLGDWQVLYSDYKDLIIEQEGTTLGYSEEELERIKELTKGYTSK